MLKHEEATDPNSCWRKAHDDERLFVLLARDPAAPEAIRAWARERIRLGKNAESDPQIVEALNAAARMADEASRINHRPHGGGLAGHDDDDDDQHAEPDLVAELGAILRRWVGREAIRLRDGQTELAVLTIRLTLPQEANDGSLYLDYDVDETSTMSRAGGALPGVPFEAPQ